jgi:hypothetical protein
MEALELVKGAVDYDEAALDPGATPHAAAAAQSLPDVAVMLNASRLARK